MNTAPAGFFSPKANEMDASSKLPFFPSGFIGDVKVAVCKGITKRDGGERAFIAELEVLTSNLPAVQVGAKHSWYQGLREPDTAYKACIGFLYACLGLDQTRDKAKIGAEIKPYQDKFLNDAVSDANPLGGRKLRLQTSTIKTKKNTDFTIHNFTPYVAPAAPTVST